jgi:hypothetical protein
MSRLQHSQHKPDNSFLNFCPPLLRSTQFFGYPISKLGIYHYKLMTCKVHTSQ